MLIISQDRTQIINTNTLVSIWAEPSVKHETVVIRGIIDYDASSFGINMGEYTREKAELVMIEIMKTVDEGKNLYFMPEGDDNNTRNK
ncbi:Uncharacterised protein [uncultured Ruminococcus sp.]|uniref:Uncharacterized protein n=1 Tax=Hominimerdicola aceti TaxID=2981726 RepID=A0AAE3IDQ3_9FIRM|nr:hypothetical protein [Hominimerdicola aceti]MCU6704318.1 hypothetical protein [Hominimerdicola aceti]SCI14133.1 Uncharacterised protein [uncultured Ruminococcus sp.]